MVHVAPTPFSITGVLGGGERYPLELARSLAKRVSCQLVTFGPRAERRRDPDGLDVRVLPARGYLGGHPAHPISLGVVQAVRHADLVHVHQMGSLPSRLAAVAARARGKPVVVTDHGLPGSRWGGLALRLFDAFLLVSSFSTRVLGAPPERTHVIYGGADPERFAPGPGPRRGVLFVGRITPHKGIEHLLLALPPGVPLTVAGSEGHDRHPPERDYPAFVRCLAAGQRVCFVTPAAEDALPDLYRGAQVFVLPSVKQTVYGRQVRISELLGLAAIEAMASGTPVVCSRVGGLVEVVEEGVTGFLVEPGDVPALRERVEALVGDGALAATMGAAARQRVLERWTWDACATRCLDAYEQVLTRAKRGRP